MSKNMSKTTIKEWNVKREARNRLGHDRSHFLFEVWA
jgi:hypothetical protein